MNLKEFRCETCGDFTRGIGICPSCGETARRVFKTAPNIGTGRARRIDAVIEGEFARRNISNYTNVSGVPRVNYGSGEYNGVRAGWGKQHLQTVQSQFQHMMPPGVAIQPPALPAGQSEALSDRNSEAWSKSVPTERMDLTPNE